LEQLLHKKYVAIFSPNDHREGFSPLVLCADSASHAPQHLHPNVPTFLFYNYDLKNKFENFSLPKPSVLNFPGQFCFESPEHHNCRLHDDLSFGTFRPIHINATVSRSVYIDKVNALKQHIQNGDIYEINYCIAFEASDVRAHPFDLYKRLNSISKAPYSAFVKLDDKYIISSSPELFLRKRGNKLLTKPIKGTAARGKNEAEDVLAKKELQTSLKERTENVMIVDVARNDLSRIANKGSVQVEKLYDIETYQQVHQMVSTVSCDLKENTSLNAILKATFPMASMTGAPKIRAMQLIDEYESNSRGPYSGCLGYMLPNGDMDLAVLIRSIFYNETERHLSFSVGSAITHLCDPAKEYDECLLKAKAMMQVLGA
jgi:para-aminobenzoate synthetase component 1